LKEQILDTTFSAEETAEVLDKIKNLIESYSKLGMGKQINIKVVMDTDREK